jgi:glycosyltransferase involved in cell wall biosynthesis
VLIVLFPLLHGEPNGTRGAHPAEAFRGLSRRARQIYSDWEWERRLGSYRVKTAISHFSARWTTKRWGGEWEVLYPPADGLARCERKENIILSVGRFTRMKKQLELVASFAGVRQTHLADWTYCCVGGLHDGKIDNDYYGLVSSAADQGTRLLPNLNRGSLLELLGRARIFWHAAGYGEDDASSPEKIEHFGIATVEAMSAGLVPIVLNKGGQSEIVEHGVSGFLWDTLDEMLHYTVRLAKDEALRDRMAQAATERAKHFSRAAFVQRFLHLSAPMLRPEVSV